MNKSPEMGSGGDALGNPNGNVGLWNKNVGRGPFDLKFHQLLERFHPAASRGKNSMCPRGFVPTPPACTKYVRS